MSTDVEICNMALSLIGQSAISSLAGTDNVSKTCNVHFNQAKNWVLMQRQWRDATKRASLATPDGTPEYGWDHYYDEPATALRILDVRANQLEDDSENTTRWVSEQGRILTDIGDGIKVKYLDAIAATALPTHVVDVVALELARRICIPITNSKKLKEQLTGMMFGEQAGDRGMIDEAAAVDGMEGRNRVLRSSKLVQVRQQNSFKAGPYVYG